MATIDVSLPEPMQGWIRSRVESGLYVDASDYVRDLIRHDQGRSGADIGAHRLQMLIAEGLTDIEAGRIYDADEVFDELEAKYAAMAEPGNPG